MDEANHCSKVGLLRRGKLIAEGSPHQLKTETSSESLEDAFLTLARGEVK
jgi:ABC-2 type transport system ATP-binding protein